MPLLSPEEYALGAPLDDDCLPTVIEMCEDILAGHIVPTENPSFWGQSIPLTRQKQEAQASPGQSAKEMKAKAERPMLRRGRNFLRVDLSRIYEEKKDEKQ